MKERRFLAEEEKFSTQRVVSYCVMIIFTAVTAWILHFGTQDQKSIIIQTVINLVIGVVAFWIGSSKGSADKEAQLNRITNKPTEAVIANTEATVVNTEALKDAK